MLIVCDTFKGKKILSCKKTSETFIHGKQTFSAINRCATSFPGSFILGKKDPGSGWSRASQKVGGDKKTAGGRSEQVAILSLLNTLWKGKICIKM